MVQIPLQVQHVRDALIKEFESLVDMSDVAGSVDQVEVHFLSRALAALMVRKLVGCSSEAAADALVDGSNDIGIDAVAVSDSGDRLWLIQSKWSNAGKASFGLAEALKFGQGLELLDLKRFDRFNPRVQDRAGLIESAWENPNLRVTLVVALMGTAPLAQHAIDTFKDLEKRYNPIFREFLDYETWHASDIWQIIRQDIAPPPIEVTAKLLEWFPLAEPFEAYQGTMPVGEVADWFEQHRERLFKQNIRESLGLTRVNQELVETLTTNPGDFWYFNNGITVLCDSAERHNWSRGTRGPIDVLLKGASVVNGAQTVTAIHTAMGLAPDVVAEAHVSVKIVTTRNTPDDFGSQVTKATNTQNRVEPRDFVALDPIQWEIREDFTLTLKKRYTFKRGELEPAPKEGVSVTNAALSLACAHGNVNLAVRAKLNMDTLWEQGAQGSYEILFKNQSPSALAIWRSFQALRAVLSWLTATQSSRDGRAYSIAISGDLLVAHLVFRNLALSSIDDLNYAWEAELDNVPELAATALRWLIYSVDELFGPNSVIKNTFASEERSQALVEVVLEYMASGLVLPELPPEYVPTATVRTSRRPNAVQTLVNSQRIAEGTLLTFRTRTQAECDAIDAWLADNPKRSQATWVNQRSKPLLWEYDRRQYSPTGLVNKIWELAKWKDRPRTVQGPDRWEIPGQGVLWKIAWAIQDEEESSEL